MSLDMFWGGAPQPINTPGDALAQLKANEFTLHEDNEPAHASHQPQTNYYKPQTGETGEVIDVDERKKLRVHGGIAAISKPITADYDSDDARIIDLKQQAYSDEYVANKLREEGRIRYVPKTVGSRWLRLRKVLERREDERLDDELSDWHVGEDEELNSIKTEVDKKFNVQFLRLREKMWKEVSVYLAEKTNKRKYTAKACQERYEALKNGTALLPIELDDDQLGRRRLREERIAAAKARRAAIEQDKKDLEAARMERIEEKKQQKIDEANRKREEIAKRHEAVHERRRKKAEKDAMRAKAREAREQWLESLRVEREWENEKLRIEKEIYKNLTGKNLLGKPSLSSTRERARKDDDEDEGVASDWESDEESGDGVESASDTDDEEDLDRADAGASFSPDRAKQTPVKKRSQPARRVSGKSASKRNSLAESDDEGDEHDEDIPVQGPASAKVRVTKATLLNPRSILNNGELKAVIRRRDITPGWQEGESHADIVARLNHIDESLSLAQLRALCKQEFLQASGRKEALVQQLAAHDAERSFAGSNLDLTSADLDFMVQYEGYTGENRKFLQEAIDEARERGEDVAEYEDVDEMEE